ncbi:thiamine pyrophosphate-binding protein [Rhizobium alvei]|uniref:Thiamine pyrophosphate-binding protein n=1 Tax=Rhizobium alvei TaxID=1132659 RepID=A0ABT8YS24_9HYPH|nr:thiamine pyrophosphate-binding protein [Rhizobium alvei]MDO6966158.1 thiamine pyrophosphate-binding protein [Rhizobium alvei]
MNSATALPAVEQVPSGQAVVDILVAEGVKAVFGMPGGHVLGIYDALHGCAEIRSYLVRHEQQAPALATGYFQLTGDLAVCLVTAGPGATNLLTSVAEAYVGSIPMIILAGRGATATAFRGASQEVSTEKIFAPVTKWSVRVDRAELLPEVLSQAFRIARSGKPGPVYIDIPRDLLTETIAAPRPNPSRSARLAADERTIREAARLLATARHPLMVAGGGVIASGAWDELRTLAESLAIPVVTSLSGRGSIADDHPLSAGGLGAHRNGLSKRLLKQADVVIGLGTRFEEMENNWRPGFVPSPEATYIQVDIDPAEISRSIPAGLGIVGDLKTVLGQLNLALAEEGLSDPNTDFRNHPRTRDCAETLASIRSELEQKGKVAGDCIHPVQAIRAVGRHLPRDASVAIDVGCLAQHMAGAFPVFEIFGPRQTITPSSFYGMGFASMALPAARIARPDHPAIGFVGDGSFQMVMPILATAAEYRLGVTWIVLNDAALGSIRDIQEHAFGNRILDTDFKLMPDLAALARACHCHGETVRNRADLDDAIARALAANENGQPAVIDIRVDRERLQNTYDHYLFYGRSEP